MKNNKHFWKKEKKYKPNNPDKKSPSFGSKQTGVIAVNSRGIGYLPVKGLKEDIEIGENFLKTALNKDEVEIIILPKSKGLRQQGEVQRIIKRAKEKFVGTIQKNNDLYFVYPDDKKFYRDIAVPKEEAEKIPENTKVQVKISWDDPKKNPIGHILEIIGTKGEHEVEIKSILLEKGFESSFSSEIEEEAEATADKEKKRMGEEISGRLDLRNTTTFTIDPANAKDFDDAISIKKLNDGYFEIGVHIADVSHYVKEGSELDREAKERGFSVYLVDRTIPMLPEILSNNLCSLNPKEDRLAFSAIFEMSKDTKIRKRWFGRTVINSNKRFTYESAQEVLNKKSGEFHEELNTLNTLSKIMRLEKERKGAINFEQDEVRFELDEKGHPIKIFKKERLDTHKLVEEFMLLANREVAEFVYNENQRNKSGFSIYRIHDLPDKERLSELATFVRALGYDLPIKSGKISPKDISAMLKKIEGKAEESLIKTAAVRSMTKAVYSTKNIGHFGLAFEYYTHFTSPIRRYPDLLVHRLLWKYLTHAKMQKDEIFTYEKMAIDASQKEISAAEAERESIKYKQVEYMKDHIGEKFEGTISGVTEWGIYIEEKNTRSEGMVRLKDIGGDYFELDQKNYSIIGKKTKKKFSLGDKVNFTGRGADIEKKTLDYVFA